MNIKAIIENSIRQNQEVLDFLNEVGRDYENADKVIPAFVDKLSQTQFNPGLQPDFTNVLQLSNDKDNFEQYELEDIRKLFDSLIGLEEFNLDLYVDAAHFEWTVMDNSNIAEKIISAGIDKAELKIAELKRLRETINNK